MANKPQNATTLPGAPMPIQVQEDEDMRPLAVVVDGKSLDVESIDDRSEDEEAWWHDDLVVRMKYQVSQEHDARGMVPGGNLIRGHLSK